MRASNFIKLCLKKISLQYHFSKKVKNVKFKQTRERESKSSQNFPCTLLAHRGLWHKKAEQNTLSAFEKAFKMGFGIECDLRDYGGKIVISHDLAHEHSLNLDQLLSLHSHYPHLPLALNIKADGLQKILKNSLEKFQTQNYFAFDMSVPDMLGFERERLRFYTRQSDLEKMPILYERACGLWLDEFKEHFIDEKLILRHLKAEKSICIVSPELHKRDFKQELSEYKEIFKRVKSDKIALCTDFPEFVREFFNE